MRAILLAGGLGTRMRPLTLGIPKPFLPVANVPLVRHQIAMVERGGATEAVLCVSYRPESVRERIAMLGSPIPIRLLWDDPPLGTGGAVRNAAEAFAGEAALVLNGDALCDADLGALAAFHRERGASCTILVTPVEEPGAYGTVEIGEDGRVLAFREKVPASETSSRTINAGVYLIEPRCLGRIATGRPVSIEREFFPALLEAGEPVAAFVHEGYWIDVGSPAAYLRVHRDIWEGTFLPPAGGDTIRPGRALFGSDTHVFERARIGANVTLGKGVVVGREALVEDVVALDGAAIGEGARVERSILGPGVRIGAHAVVQDAVLGEGSVVTDHSRIGTPGF